MTADRNETAIHRRMTVGLGTFVSIEVHGPPAVEGAAALDAACAALDRVESLMHPARAGSDIAALAAQPPGELLRVHPWTFEVMTLARHVSVASGGRFDPCVPELAGRFADLDFIPGDGLCRRRADLAVDLGGIAKGFAIDRAVEALQRAGCVAGQVNVGGDLRVFGPDQATVAIRVDRRIAGSVMLRDRALAVSAPRSDHSPSEHRGFYCALTGAVVAGRNVAIVAPTAAVADALTKCALLCESEHFARLLTEFDAQEIELRREDQP